MAHDSEVQRERVHITFVKASAVAAMQHGTPAAFNHITRSSEHKPNLLTQLCAGMYTPVHLAAIE
eukprot:CAMPEP_0119359128 /NCGR_PEP_ID=MMETSP1334-20130426/7099_1 /TAXON_ID=127549 /ORGANISM="Calcidiscus leptoporus, Strain RCC1130" /LENGTH=64 /DNA_ID=CAMNT_0007373739 /DNA_START=445 /DNA_END=639 /DNA_ORIENTATION=-